jgi:predicted GNAT family N-acyltransferase
MRKNREDLQVFRFKESDKELFNEARKIRYEVFVEEQKVPQEIEFDGLDQIASHYLMIYKDLPACTSRLRRTKKGMKLERFAVSNKLRGRGIGKELLMYMLDDLKNNRQEIYLHAQKSAIPFYEKMGFSKIGEEFLEAGIKHITMKLINH